MKVVYVIDTLETGGAEQSLLEITSRLTKTTPVVCHLYRGDALKSKFEAAGIKVISLGLSGPYQFVQAFKKLKAVCASERPDLIVSALYRAEITSRCVAKSLKIPQVGSFVSDSYSEHKKSTFSAVGRVKFKFFYWINRLTARLSVAYISNSESIKQSNSKALNIPLNKIHTIYRGRLVKGIVRADSSHPEIKFLNVGRLIRGKGQAELIRAFSEFLKTHTQATLTIAGEGSSRKGLEQEIAFYNLQTRVSLLGNVEDVSALYAQHDCLVFPSHYEGFSGVLVEAMLARLPILASDIPMNLEALEHKKTGFVFAVKNEASILEAMKWFSANRSKATAMAEEAYTDACNRFDIKSIVQQHESLYEVVVTNYPAR